MTSVADVVAFLGSSGQLASAPSLAPATLVEHLREIRSISAAGRGHLSWLSPSALKRRTSPVDFQGSLLIVPADAPDTIVGDRIVRCHQPKLALILVHERYFSDPVVREWPAVAPASVESDAVIGANVTFGAGVVVGPGCVIGRDVSIGPHCVLAQTTLGSNCSVGAGSVLGRAGFGFERDAEGRARRFPHLGRVIVGSRVALGNQVCIDRGALGDTELGDDVQVDSQTQISHNVSIGARTVVCGRVAIAGSVRVGADAWIAPGVTVLNQIKIGDGAFVGLGSVVIASVPAGGRVFGNPAARHGRKR